MWLTYDISKIQQISAVKLKPRPFKANHGPVLARSLWAIQLHGEVHQSFTKSSNSPIFPHACFTKTYIYNDLQVFIIYIIHIYIYIISIIYISYIYLHTSTPASSETFSARNKQKTPPRSGWAWHQGAGGKADVQRWRRWLLDEDCRDPGLPSQGSEKILGKSGKKNMKKLQDPLVFWSDLSFSL